MREKAALLPENVYCPKVVDYGLIALVKHCYFLATLCNDGKHFVKFLAKYLTAIWGIPHNFFSALNLSSKRY